MNSDELEQTLMEIYYEEEEALTNAAGWRRCAAVLRFLQVDAAAGVEEADDLGGGGAQVCRCVAKREVEDDKEKGEMKRLSDPIYKERGNRRARKMRRPKNDYLAARTPRFSGWLLKIRIC